MFAQNLLDAQLSTPFPSVPPVAPLRLLHPEPFHTKDPTLPRTMQKWVLVHDTPWTRSYSPPSPRSVYSVTGACQLLPVQVTA